MRQTLLRYLRSAAPLVLLIAALFAQFGVWYVCFAILADSPNLDITFERAEDHQAHCHWRTETGSVDEPRGGRRVICVKSLAGVQIRENSLLREPGYIDTPEELQSWFVDQDAMYRALKRGGEVHLSGVTSGGTSVDLVVHTTAFDLWSQLGNVLPFLLPAAGLFLVGLFVLIRRPQSTASRAMAVFGFAGAVSLGCTMVNAARGVALPHTAARTLLDVNQATNLVMGVSLFYLAANFPAKRFGRYTETLALIGPAALATAFYVADIVLRTTLSTEVFALLLLGTLVLFGLTQIRPGPQIQRLQARWILWGLSVPLVAFLITRLPILFSPAVRADPTDTLIALSGLTIPLGIAVAILKYQLLNIEIVIRRTALGAVTTLLVLSLYYWLVSSLASISYGGEDRPYGSTSSGFEVVLVTALVLTLLLLPMQSGLERALDRYFARNRYHYRRVLARVPEELTVIQSSDEAVQHVLRKITGSMEVQRCVALLTHQSGEGGSITRSWASGEVVPAPPHIRGEAQIVDKPLLRDAAAESHKQLMSWMDAQGLELVLPMRLRDSFLGMLACSSPAGNRAFGREDVEVLKTVVASLALTLSRIVAYETIRDMNQQLEARVEARTRELAQTRLQLFQWEKMASLGVLAAGIAHELNTPLGVVTSASDQLVRRCSEPEIKNPDKVRQLASLCRDAGQRAAGIVQDIREFSSVQRGRVERMDLCETLDSALKLLQSRIRRHGVEVVVKKCDMPLVECYPGLINQVFVNLLLNAISAADSGGCTITIEMESRNDEVVIVFQDDGPGVPEEIRDRIFEPFFTTKMPGEGTGLGLSIAYSIMERHGGSIRLTDSPVGARFIITMPIMLTDKSLDAALVPPLDKG